MSGVFGVVDFDDPSHVAPLLAAMRDRLHHFRWDMSEIYVDSQAGIGLGQTNIGILERAQKPVWNTEHTLAVLMAGEFYGDEARYSDLAGEKSEEDLVLHLYETQGEEFVRDLDGAFVIAIWDTRHAQLLILNDHFGLYPTFIAQAGNRFIFAPQVKAVLADSNVDRTLREDSVAEFMRFQHLLGFKTFFSGINLLPPASILRFRKGDPTYRLESYWDMSQVALLPESTRFPEAVEEAGRLFRASVLKMSKGQKRIGVFLSGGLDGRGILGMTPREGREVHTFTFGQPGCRDEYYARRIAEAAGVQHHFYPYEDGKWVLDFVDLHLKLTEGFVPWFHIHGLNILDDVRQHVDVNLSGLGDLLWLQSNFTPLHLMDSPDDIAFNATLFERYSQKYTWPGLTYAGERYLYHESFFPRVRGLAFDSFVEESNRYAGLPYPQRLAAFNLVNHFLRYIMYSGVFGSSYLVYRYPYFDLELMSFCYGLPVELNMDRKLQRAIIVNEMPALARVPHESDEIPLSHTGIRRAATLAGKKLKSGIHRFVAPVFPPRPTLYADYENWLRTDLRDWAEAILFDERTLDRRIFRPEALRSLMDRHLAGVEPWTLGKIGHIITFEMMLRSYIDTE